MVNVDRVRKLLAENAKGLGILIAEDDLVTLNIYRATCDKYFKNVRIAKNGQHAYEIYKAHKDEIDIVMTDLNMPKLNGIGLVKKIREEDLDVAILVVSAYSEVEKFIELINEGVDGFILKPIQPMQLLSQLNKITKIKSDKKALNVYQQGLESYLDAILQSNKKKDELEAIVQTTVEVLPDEYIRAINLALTKKNINSSTLLRMFGKKKQITEATTPKNLILPTNHSKEIIETNEKVKISAKEYLDLIEFDKYNVDILEDVYLLDDYSKDIYEKLEYEEYPNLDTLFFDVGSIFERYSTILQMFVEFKNLAGSVLEIALFLKNLKVTQIEDIESKNIPLFKSLIGALVVDIDKWKDSIFIYRDAIDIHFWDHQIDSITKEIQNYFRSAIENEDDDSDIMFF